MKKRAKYMIFLLLLTIGVCSPVFFDADLMALSADNEAFNNINIPIKPPNNKNLITGAVKLIDNSGGALGVKLIDGEIKNTSDTANGVIQFQHIKGMKNDDTYVLKYTYEVNRASPNEAYKDYSSMGARVYFRGVDKSNFVAFSLFKESAVILVYSNGTITDMPASVPFKRVDKKKYKITILTSLNTARIWVDGVLLITAKNLPEYDFGIGADIYRAAVTMNNFELYNVNKDNAEVNAPDVTAAVQKMAGDTLSAKTVVTPNILDRYIVILVVCGVFVLLSISAIIYLVLIIRKKKKIVK